MMSDEIKALLERARAMKSADVRAYPVDADKLIVDMASALDRLSGRVTMTDRKTTIARAICAERCAEYGEPPCYEFFGEIEPHRRTMDCSDAHQCSCEQLAVAVEAELARPALIAREGGEG